EGGPSPVLRHRCRVVTHVVAQVQGRVRLPADSSGTAGESGVYPGGQLDHGARHGEHLLIRFVGERTVRPVRQDRPGCGYLRKSGTSRSSPSSKTTRRRGVGISPLRENGLSETRGRVYPPSPPMG